MCIEKALLYESDTFIPATELMTKEEVIETLKRVCAAFDQKTLNAIAEQVHFEYSIKNLQRELDHKEKRLAQLESDISLMKLALAKKDVELLEKDARLSEKEVGFRDRL